MFTRVESQLYHEGHWLIDPRGRFLGFKSLNTGWVYGNDVIEQVDSDAARADWTFGKPARDGHLYAEDVRIWHEFTADVGFNRDGEAEINDLELDGYPCDFDCDPMIEAMMDDLWIAFERENV